MEYAKLLFITLKFLISLLVLESQGHYQNSQMEQNSNQHPSLTHFLSAVTFQYNHYPGTYSYCCFGLLF